eukprot:5448550-Karenia_brevis.AAC.1
MKHLYENDAFAAQWASSHDLTLLAPDVACPDFLSGGALPSLGYSNAVEYMTEHENHVANHCVFDYGD